MNARIAQGVGIVGTGVSTMLITMGFENVYTFFGLGWFGCAMLLGYVLENNE
jgi:hypothetical protein